MQLQLTAVFQQVPEGYIGFVEELPGANTQAATFEDARANLQEAIQLVFEANRSLPARSGATSRSHRPDARMTSQVRLAADRPTSGVRF